MAEAFGAQLRRRREARAVAQKTLARAVGLSPSMITLLEQAERRPTREQILRIASALELDAAETDELLTAGGQLPGAYDRTPPSDPDLVLVADVLGDAAIPEEDRQRLRLLIRLECQRWRPTALDLGALLTRSRSARAAEGSDEGPTEDAERAGPPRRGGGDA